MLIYYMLQTVELWIFLAVLGTALVGEEVYNKMKARNEAHQLRINAEIDRLHK